VVAVALLIGVTLDAVVMIGGSAMIIGALRR
jgi:hypothetical protein